MFPKNSIFTSDNNFCLDHYIFLDGNASLRSRMNPLERVFLLEALQFGS